MQPTRETGGGFGHAPDLAESPAPDSRNETGDPISTPLFGEGSGELELLPPQRRRAVDTVKRKERRAPEDAPTYGWRGQLAKLAVSLGAPQLIPQPSTTELRDRRLHQKHSEVWRLTDQIDGLTVATFNRKGGAGKTALSSHQASILKQTAFPVVSFIDGNPGSTSPGRVMSMYNGEEKPSWVLEEPPLHGMQRRTVSVLELQQALESEQVAVGQPLLNLVRQNHYGVHTLVAHQRVRQGEELTAKMVESVFPSVIDSSQFSFIDTGNEPTSAAQQAIARLSDEFVFVAYVRMPESLDDLRPLMDTLRSREEFRRKVDNATVVILGTPPGGNVDDYRSFVGNHDGPVLGVPYDERMHHNRSVRLDQLDIGTYEALLDVLISVLKQKVHPNTS